MHPSNTSYIRIFYRNHRNILAHVACGKRLESLNDSIANVTTRRSLMKRLSRGRSNRKRFRIKGINRVTSVREPSRTTMGFRSSLTCSPVKGHRTRPYYRARVAVSRVASFSHFFLSEARNDPICDHVCAIRIIQYNENNRTPVRREPTGRYSSSPSGIARRPANG